MIKKYIEPKLYTEYKLIILNILIIKKYFRWMKYLTKELRKYLQEKHKDKGIF